jgi:ribosomal protein S18 acetylase RimI-like enzyme
MIIIRNANKDDITTIVKFNSAMAMETEHKSLDIDTVNEGVKELLNNSENGFYLIAESDGIPVGQLMITKEWSDWRNAEFWWIQSVYVHADYRGNNIYRKLYDEAVKLAKESEKVCGIRLYVDKDNNIAQKVYTKLGMKESNYIFFEEDWSDV